MAGNRLQDNIELIFKRVGYGYGTGFMWLKHFPLIYPRKTSLSIKARDYIDESSDT